jgi:hypothetical protein
VSHKPDVILIQETMSEGSKARAMLEPQIKGWYFCSMDVTSQSGGLIMGWSPKYKVYLLRCVTHPSP